MRRLLNSISDGHIIPPVTRHPIMWSEAYRTSIRRIGAGESKGFSSIDAALAEPLLRCSDGEFEDAERDILKIFEANVEACERDPEVFISLLNAFFIVQRLDIVAGMLKARHRFPKDLQVKFEEGMIGAGGVQWSISADDVHTFSFDAVILRNDNTRIDILLLHWAFPLLAYYAAQPEYQTGSVFLSRTDVGVKPGLAYCDNRPDYFLIPDYIFVPTQGYASARTILLEARIQWEDRTPLAFWRGATTGVPASPGDWRSLERIKLCEIACSQQQTGLIDAGISSVIQFSDPLVVEEIRASGLVRGPVPWKEWGQFKYLIDIDGNSSPWSNLFQRLLTGSTVLKVESRRGLRQWFYDDLVPWENYVPVAPDMCDLMDKIRWLRRHDRVAQRIGENGRLLAERMTYERELQRSVPIISSAFRYFRKDYSVVTPYGRPMR